MMIQEIELFQKGRKNLIGITKELSLDELNEIPEKFTGNINIAWHLGHCAVTHKGLIYALNSGKVGLPKDFIKKYSKGETPNGPINKEERDFIFETLEAQMSELDKDLNTDDFFGKNYPYHTQYEYTIDSLEKAVKFSNIHQAMHLGYIMALKRMVKA